MKVLKLLTAAAVLTCTISAYAQTDSDKWPNPDPQSLHAGAWKDTVLYGRKLFNETYAVIGPEVARRTCAIPETTSPARAVISRAARNNSPSP